MTDHLTASHARLQTSNCDACLPAPYGQTLVSDQQQLACPEGESFSNVLHLVAGHHSIDLLMLQMMTFTQHPYMLLSGKALPLWTALLTPRDSVGKQEGHTPSPSHTLLPLECVSALLDLAGDLPTELLNAQTTCTTPLLTPYLLAALS